MRYLSRSQTDKPSFRQGALEVEAEGPQVRAGRDGSVVNPQGRVMRVGQPSEKMKQHKTGFPVTGHTQTEAGESSASQHTAVMLLEQQLLFH